MSQHSGVGMPAGLYLQKFGEIVADAFGEIPYQVGSSLPSKGTPWRDVDVRLILDDERYEREFGNWANPHGEPRWVAMTLAFSALGKNMTGLPIDFQIQQRTDANAKYDSKSGHSRSALFDLTRIVRQQEAKA